MMKYKTVAVAMLAGMGLGAIAVQSIHAQAKPPFFLIFDAEIKDEASYRPFLQTAVREVQNHGGKFLVAGATPEMLAGNSTSNRISISQWASKEDVMRWFNSGTMKPVREAQAKYTATRLIVVEGRAH